MSHDADIPETLKSVQSINIFGLENISEKKSNVSQELDKSAKIIHKQSVNAVAHEMLSKRLEAVMKKFKEL